VPMQPSQLQRILNKLNDLAARFDALEERRTMNDAYEDLEEEREKQSSVYSGAPIAPVRPEPLFSDGIHGGVPEKIHGENGA
jgi:hypothetical protein